jgi:dTDP-4-amino-4,6-dideoxygalactose transaminase
MAGNQLRPAGVRFPFIRPSVPRPEDWLPDLAASYEVGWFSNRGPAVQAFEEELTERFGREATAVANATVGLTAVLLALDVRGRVVLPSFTFPATACAVDLVGCKPVFCDVDEETWELDPAALKELLAAGAAAVIHVRAFGLCRDLSAVEDICAAAGVPLVVDSAAGLGGRTAAGDEIGHAGVCEVFSLHATKPFAVGEGGAVLGDATVIDGVRRTSNFGLVDDDVVGRGLNAKMDEFAAGRSRAMLRRLDAEIEGRARHAAAYRDSLDHPLVAHPVDPGAPPWQTYPVQLRDPDARPALLNELAARGIEVRGYYAPALHESSAFRSAVHLPVSERLSRSMVCLPNYGNATDDEISELTGLIVESLEAVTNA